MSFPYKVKSDIITELSKKFPQIPPTEMNSIVNNIIELMSLSLTNGSSIEIRGFGRFILCWYEGRKAHNPKTGSPVFTIENCRPRFKTGKQLKDSVALSTKKEQETAAA